MPRHHGDQLEICDQGHDPVAYASSDCPACSMLPNWDQEDREQLEEHESLVRDVLEKVDFYEDVRDSDDDVKTFLALESEQRILFDHMVAEPDLYLAVHDNVEDLKAWLADGAKNHLVDLNRFVPATRFQLLMAVRVVAALSTDRTVREQLTTFGDQLSTASQSGE